MAWDCDLKKRKRRWPVQIRDYRQEVMLVVQPDAGAVRIDFYGSEPALLSPHQAGRLMQAVKGAADEVEASCKKG